MSTPSPVPGQIAPLFGTIPASNVQPTLFSVSGPMGPCGLTLHVSVTTFSVNSYGASSADQPKKVRHQEQELYAYHTGYL